MKWQPFFEQVYCYWQSKKRFSGSPARTQALSFARSRGQSTIFSRVHSPRARCEESVICIIQWCYQARDLRALHIFFQRCFEMLLEDCAMYSFYSILAILASYSCVYQQCLFCSSNRRGFAGQMINCSDVGYP